MAKVINVYQSDNQVIRDAIDKVIVQVYRKKREKGHISFLLTGCSAGCGTTYTAIHMAIALADAGWKTVLVDCDIRKGMIYKRLNQEAEYGLSDYLVGKVKEPFYHTNHAELDYIPCGNDQESPVRLLCTKKMEQLAVELSEKYDFIIYDFPSLEIVPDAGIMMPVVDDVILVAAVDETSKEQLAKAKINVKSYGDKYMGVILNKIGIAEYRHYVKDYDYFVTNMLRQKHDKDMKHIKSGAAQVNKSKKKESK